MTETGDTQVETDFKSSDLKTAYEQMFSIDPEKRLTAAIRVERHHEKEILKKYQALKEKYKNSEGGIPMNEEPWGNWAAHRGSSLVRYSAETQIELQKLGGKIIRFALKGESIPPELTKSKDPRQ